MNKLLAVLDSMLSDIRYSRVSKAPAQRVTLAPVWAMPMLSHSESSAAPTPRDRCAA